MKDDIEKIRMAVDAWYGGNATELQEEMLRRYFSSADMKEMPREFRAVAQMMAGFGEMAHDRMPGAAGLKVRPSHKAFWGSVAAASAALVIVCGLLAGRTVYGYDYDGSAITDREKALASTECLDCLSLLDDNLEYIDELFK